MKNNKKTVVQGGKIVVKKKRYLTIKSENLPSSNLSVIHDGMSQPLHQDIGDEPHFIDTNTAGTIFSTATITDLLPVTQGVGVNSRIGDALILRKGSVMLQVENINADVFNVLRMIILQWLDNSIVPPTLADIMQSVSTNSHYNWQNSGRFRVLLDVRLGQVGDTGASSASAFQVATFPINFAAAKPKVLFNNGLTSGFGKIYSIFWSTSAIAPGPNVLADYRIEFDD